MMKKVVLWQEMTMANRLGWFSGDPDEDFGNCMWGPRRPSLEEMQEEHGIRSWDEVDIRPSAAR